MKAIKPKRNSKEAAKPARAVRRPAEPAEVPTPSSQPEQENDDTEAMPPGADSAEAEDERTRERAADDGMPDEDKL